jgi:hypothetical protein
MINHSKLRFLVIPLIVFGLMLMVSTAQAFDRKTYSGQICKPYFASNNSQVDLRYDGAYNNSATSAVWVSCPVIRDDKTGTNGFGGTTYVRVYRSSITATSMRCYLRQQDVLDSTPGTALGSDSETWAGTGWRWMSLNITGAGQSQDWGPAVMYCYVPARSKIYSYSVYEETPTDLNN